MTKNCTIVIDSLDEVIHEGGIGEQQPLSERSFYNVLSCVLTQEKQMEKGFFFKSKRHKTLGRLQRKQKVFEYENASKRPILFFFIRNLYRRNKQTERENRPGRKIPRVFAVRRLGLLWIVSCGQRGQDTIQLASCSSQFGLKLFDFSPFSVEMIAVRHFSHSLMFNLVSTDWKTRYLFRLWGKLPHVRFVSYWIPMKVSVAGQDYPSTCQGKPNFSPVLPEFSG